jgi:RNA polymerase sigma-70 factor (ECF subfamily)
VEIARDIVSETFFKAIRGLWTYQWRNIPFSAWLYRIANNEINRYFRQSRYRSESFELMLERGGVEIRSDDDPAEVILAQEELEKHNARFLFYKQKISELPPKYQEALALRYFEEKSINEICQILGKREGTVKSLLHRGILRLKTSPPAAEMQLFDSRDIIKGKSPGTGARPPGNPPAQKRRKDPGSAAEGRNYDR